MPTGQTTQGPDSRIHMNPMLPRQRGFTLIELLVVISIILLLATLGLTKIMGARRDAEMTASLGRLGDIYAEFQRYERKSKTKRLPGKKHSGSDFVMAIWGGRYIEKSVNTAGVMFCASLGMPEISDETIDEDVTAATIHWAGRTQADRNYAVGKLSDKGASKTIIVCNKPITDEGIPHQGEALAVLYLSGHTGELTKDLWGDDDIEVLTIGPESPVEALQGLSGSPEDEY